MPGNPPQGAPLPYEEVTDLAYVGFADDCQVVESAAGARLVGVCRRCDDAMEYPLPRVVISKGLVPRRRKTVASGELTMLCTCQEAHPGRPAAGHGCGAYWNVALEDGSQ